MYDNADDRDGCYHLNPMSIITENAWREFLQNLGKVRKRTRVIIWEIKLTFHYNQVLKHLSATHTDHVSNVL